MFTAAGRGEGASGEHQGRHKQEWTRMPHGAHLGMNLISTVKAALPNATGSHCNVSSLTETWISHIIHIF